MLIYLYIILYLGNPMGGGSLLTRQWGYDIIDFIYNTTGMITYIYYVNSVILGIEDAEYREVYVSIKPGIHKLLTNPFQEKLKLLKTSSNKKQQSTNMITCEIIKIDEVV